MNEWMWELSVSMHIMSASKTVAVESMKRIAVEEASKSNSSDIIVSGNCTQIL